MKESIKSLRDAYTVADAEYQAAMATMKATEDVRVAAKEAIHVAARSAGSAAYASVRSAGRKHDEGAAANRASRADFMSNFPKELELPKVVA